MQKGKFEVQVAAYGLLLTFLWAIRARSIDKKILRKIMAADYRESSSRVVALDDTALEATNKKVLPKNDVFWGKPQVV